MSRVVSYLFFFLVSFCPLFCNELREILAKYNIDGFDRPGGTDKDTSHSYLESYAELLHPYKDRPCTLLEIGSLHGGSALLWCDYLPQAQMLLLDIKYSIDQSIWKAIDFRRCRFLQLDAYTTPSVRIAQQLHPEGYDIIIDDGDHELESQLFLLSNYVDLLNEGGILIIEDIPSDEHLKALKSARPRGCTMEIRDLRQQKGRWDDLLFIVRKKRSS